MNSILEEIKVSNIDIPDSITNGVYCLDYGIWAIVIQGQAVDICYGNEQEAYQQLAIVQEELAAYGRPDMETPWDELVEDDTYWINGDCPRLDKPACPTCKGKGHHTGVVNLETGSIGRIKCECQIDLTELAERLGDIPWQGEPVNASDGYGLEARG